MDDKPLTPDELNERITLLWLVLHDLKPTSMLAAQYCRLAIMDLESIERGDRPADNQLLC